MFSLLSMSVLGVSGFGSLPRVVRERVGRAGSRATSKVETEIPKYKAWSEGKLGWTSYFEPWFKPLAMAGPMETWTNGDIDLWDDFQTDLEQEKLSQDLLREISGSLALLKDAYSVAARSATEMGVKKRLIWKLLQSAKEKGGVPKFETAVGEYKVMSASFKGSLGRMSFELIRIAKKGGVYSTKIAAEIAKKAALTSPNEIVSGAAAAIGWGVEAVKKFMMTKPAQGYTTIGAARAGTVAGRESRRLLVSTWNDRSRKVTQLTALEASIMGSLFN